MNYIPNLISTHLTLVDQYQAEILSFEPLLDLRKAKREAFRHLELALLNRLRPAYYVAPLDPGLGKSTLIMHFLRLWKRSGFTPDGGVVVCLSRLDEIESFTANCGLSKADYAVVTTDSRLNSYGLGYDRANEARVIFTTQQMVHARCRRAGSFQSIKEYHFRGEPRSCRIWDGSLLPAQDVVIQIDHLASLAAVLRVGFKIEMGLLDEFLHDCRELIALGKGRQLAIPTALQEHFATALPWRVVEALPLSNEQQNAIQNLVALADSTVALQMGAKGAWALVGAEKPLPNDFMPAIVFDASARVRATYQEQEQHRRNIVFLPAATTNYSRLTIHAWNHAMGSENRCDPTYLHKVLLVAADRIRSLPGEEWLIVHHKLRMGAYDIATSIKSLVGPEAKVSFIHWGSHHGTNAYRDIKNVIVLGAWIKPRWCYNALYIAASGLLHASIDKEAYDRIRLGELSHDMLQAICRSNVRNVVDGVCGEVNIYLVANMGSGHRAAIECAFPSAKIVNWEPLIKPMRGKMLDLTSYLKGTFDDPSVNAVTKIAAREAIGSPSSHSMSQLLKDGRMRTWFADRGIRMEHHRFVRDDPRS